MGLIQPSADEGSSPLDNPSEMLTKHFVVVVVIIIVVVKYCYSFSQLLCKISRIILNIFRTVKAFHTTFNTTLWITCKSTKHVQNDSFMTP